MDWTLKLVFILCAAIGGAVLLLQNLLMLFGGGDGPDDVSGAHDAVGAHDAHAGHDHGAGAFNLLSFRAIVAFVTFFGLGGWAGEIYTEWGPLGTVALATLAGFVAMLVVAWVLSLQSKLNTEGTLDPKNAVGGVARVYLRIPAHRSGQGKITVLIQGRTAEYTALSDGDELPTGSQVRLLALVGPDTFLAGPIESGR